MIKTVKFASLLTLALLFLAGMAFAQSDPGVQGGTRCTTVGTNTVCTGTALPSVQQDSPAGILAFFNDGFSRFQDVESVANSPSANNGLGPRFNFNQCAGCHAQPAVGGTGPALNPQFAGFGSCTNGTGTGPGGVVQTFTPVNPGQPTAPEVGTMVCNTTNTVPSFITAHGPTREARFPFFFNPDGSANTANPNGGVEDLFTVAGRGDGAGSCNPGQPSFAAAAAANNLIFRIPTPVFGVGLIENLDDSTLQKNRANNLNNNFGIGGDFNHNGNDGTITRFGWKAQNKSGHIFAGEAYNVEMGISNLLFTQDRPLPGEDGNGGTGSTGLPANCLNLTGTGYPEDNSNPVANNTTNNAAAVLDDVSAFANFMRSLAAPVPSTTTPGGSASISRGASLFSAIGCATCHNPSPGTTQVSNFTPSLSQAAVNSFSDIEIHHMGVGLADNVGQGGAGGDQFRTAPLWGVGQRIFLLHDGRTTNLITAINQHDSNGSEADIPTDNFQNLSPSQQQDVLNFLRSL
ncbi:MAG TPA: di-heme oxidoredictase family protein [Candidatus Angelobacter sp.]